MKRKFNSQIISSFILLVVTGALLLTLLIGTTAAWFSNSKRVSATGMALHTESKSIELSESLTVVRTLGSQVTEMIYKRDTDGGYYLYENGAFTLDDEGERITLSMAELLPGETVDITLGYTCSDNLLGESIDVYFTGIESDSFAEIENPEITHTVLGVYKLSVDSGEGFADERWLTSYVLGVTDVCPERIDIKSDTVWDKTEGVYEYVTFRIEFDLEQYYSLKTATNQLSEKRFSISQIRIGVSQ